MDEKTEAQIANVEKEIIGILHEGPRSFRPPISLVQAAEELPPEPVPPEEVHADPVPAPVYPVTIMEYLRAIDIRLSDIYDEIGNIEARLDDKLKDIIAIMR